MSKIQSQPRPRRGMLPNMPFIFPKALVFFPAACYNFFKDNQRRKKLWYG